VIFTVTQFGVVGGTNVSGEHITSSFRADVLGSMFLRNIGACVGMYVPTSSRLYKGDHQNFQINFCCDSVETGVGKLVDWL
jgi:hypothetical protein